MEGDLDCVLCVSRCLSYQFGRVNKVKLGFFIEGKLHGRWRSEAYSDWFLLEFV